MSAISMCASGRKPVSSTKISAQAAANVPMFAPSARTIPLMSVSATGKHLIVIRPKRSPMLLPSKRRAWPPAGTPAQRTNAPWGISPWSSRNGLPMPIGPSAAKIHSHPYAGGSATTLVKMHAPGVKLMTRSTSWGSNGLLLTGLMPTGRTCPICAINPSLGRPSRKNQPQAGNKSPLSAPARPV